MRMCAIDKDQVIDSRDIISRIEELQEEREALEFDEDQEFESESAKRAAEFCTDLDLTEWDRINGAELAELLALQDECEGYSDWRHGETLIRHDCWEEYVKELLEDCGDIPENLPHYIEIDWETTAENIAQDYSVVSFGNTDYYIRNC